MQAARHHRAFQRALGDRHVADSGVHHEFSLAHFGQTDVTLERRVDHGGEARGDRHFT